MSFLWLGNKPMIRTSKVAFSLAIQKKKAFHLMTPTYIEREC